jgi:hypothetical protein
MIEEEKLKREEVKEGTTGLLAVLLSCLSRVPRRAGEEVKK